MEGVTYPKFQKDLVKIYANKVASYLQENDRKLKEEVEGLRNNLYRDHDIFSVLPEVLFKTYEYALSPNPNDTVTLTDEKLQNEYERYVQTKVQDIKDI